MSKDTFYFSHDYNTRTDDKIKKLIRAHGMQGYGIFWAIVEDLYNNANALRTDYEGIAYDLRVDAMVVKSIINDFDLFCFENGSFGSSSIEKRIDERNSKSEKARQSAFKRWNKIEPDANALPTQSECNTIKESKVKESKVKEIETRKIEFEQLVFENNPLKYDQEMLRAFCNYWTESNKSKTKMRFELEKVFEIGRRLATWKSREKTFINNKPNGINTGHSRGHGERTNSYWNNET